ncbi:histidine-phosphotransfer domain, HPT domain-containing protein [Mycena leptocephala]|nr:histidine-phosphotransfer domain, HPT domain-containing protein [Mycena leptocephala]
MANDPPNPRSPPAPKDPVPAPKVPKGDDPATPRPPTVPESVPDPPADSEACPPIDMIIFNQILELDEPDSHEFSKEMVLAYFAQASTTFEDMDRELADEKLLKLSELGHFLKGSSAALGIKKVQAACEKMQHYGELRDEVADKDLKADEALALIKALLVEVKAEYADAERWLKKWYVDEGDAIEEPVPVPKP